MLFYFLPCAYVKRSLFRQRGYRVKVKLFRGKKRSFSKVLLKSGSHNKRAPAHDARTLAWVSNVRIYIVSISWVGVLSWHASSRATNTRTHIKSLRRNRVKTLGKCVVPWLHDDSIEYFGKWLSTPNVRLFG